MNVNSLPCYNICQEPAPFVFSNSHQFCLSVCRHGIWSFKETVAQRGIRDWGPGTQREQIHWDRAHPPPTPPPALCRLDLSRHYLYVRRVQGYLLREHRWQRTLTLGLCTAHVGKAIIKGFKWMAEMERLSLHPFCSALNDKMRKLWNIKLNSAGKLFLERDGLVHLDACQLYKHPIIWLVISWFCKPHTGSLYCTCLRHRAPWKYRLSQMPFWVAGAWLSPHPGPLKLLTLRSQWPLWWVVSPPKHSFPKEVVVDIPDWMAACRKDGLLAE